MGDEQKYQSATAIWCEWYAEYVKKQLDRHFLKLMMDKGRRE